MAARAQKATFALAPDILTALGEAVAQGVAPSKNALVERALRNELKDIRRAARRREWEAAASDPLFLKDVAEVEAAFTTADAETARRIG